MVQAGQTARRNVTSLKIDPEVVSNDDVEMLQDLVMAALNDAARKVDQAIQENGTLTGGLKIPGF